MAYPTDWNVEDYRNENESEEHWKLRSNFMNKCKGNFPEDRIVCLAKVFANIEFLGCRYPTEVMALVAELSKEVAIDFREAKKKKLQRTFVSASDAAEDRAKGTKRASHAPVVQSDPSPYKKFIAATPDNHPASKLTNQNSSEINKNPSKYAISQNSNWRTANSNISESPGNRIALNDRKRSYNSRIQQNSNNVHRNQFDRRPNENYSNLASNIINTEYGRLVLFDRQGSFANKLFASCQHCKVEISADYSRIGEEWRSSLTVNNLLVCTVPGQSQKESKEAACQEAWKILQKTCHTIVVKKTHTENNDTISAKEVDQDEGSTRLTDGLETKVDSAIATRMMKLMGWSGGSLGATADGICEPIQPNLKQIRRLGLGSAASGRSIKEALIQTINEYSISTTADHDLVFASDFSKEERADMHKIAQKRGLKSKSYGKDDDRYLVISRAISPQQLVYNLKNSGGSNEKYELLLPGTTT